MSQEIIVGLDIGTTKVCAVVGEVRDDQVEIVLYWPRGLEGLTDRLQDLQHRIVPTGAVWAVIPKKKYARKWGIDFSWEELQAAGLQTDLVDNKVASIDEETYGTRFVIRAEFRDKYRD